MATAPKLRRRMSVDDANVDLLGHVHKTIERLSTLWDQVSMDQTTREKRTESAYTLFYSSMNEIVQNEEEMVKGVFEDIERDLADVTATRKELDLPPFPADNYPPKSIALLKALGKDKKSLLERKTQMMARQLDEYDELAKVCARLGEELVVIPSVKETVLPKSEVDKMCKQRLNLGKELQKRKSQLLDLQKKCNGRLHVLKQVQFSAEEKELLGLDINASTTVLSNSLIQSFSNLLEKFETEYFEFCEKFITQYSECYSKLTELAEKCYAFALRDDFPETIDLEVHDESLLTKIRSNLQMLETRYENGKELFDIFSQWHATFKKQDEIEVELTTDRARRNRGGYLTQLLADQKKNNANFDRTLSELKLACDQAPGLEVTINELSPYNFALQLIQDREQQKENEKLLKKIDRVKQLQMDSKFGTSVIGSPASKGAATYGSRITPKSTPVASRTPVKTKFSKSPFKLF